MFVSYSSSERFNGLSGKNWPPLPAPTKFGFLGVGCCLSSFSFKVKTSFTSLIVLFNFSSSSVKRETSSELNGGAGAGGSTKPIHRPF